MMCRGLQLIQNGNIFGDRLQCPSPMSCHIVPHPRTGSSEAVVCTWKGLQ